MAAELLRRKLAALGYPADFDEASAPLVERLVSDLVSATESYQALGGQCQQQQERADQAGYQVDILKREAGRLTGENTQLRQDLLREADQRAGLEKAHYQAAKQLEAQLSAAQFAREQIVQRLTAAERENEGLRQKANSLLSLGRECALGEGVVEPLSRITISKPLEPKPAPAAAAKTSRGAVSLIKAADHRILALEGDLKRRAGQLQALEEQLGRTQEDVRRRDAEIARLSSQLCAGPDVDKLAWQYRNEANEAVILQLNQQVEALTHELTDLQQRAVDRSTLEAVEQSRREAEARAAALERERGSIAAEVEDMQKALTRLQQEASSETQARSRLAKMKVTLEEVRGQKAQLEGQLTHAETKVADLRERLEQKEAAVRKAQQRCKQLEAELKQRPPALAVGEAEGRRSAAEGGEGLEASCSALQAQLEEAERLREEAVTEQRAVEKERDLLQDQLQHTAGQLADAQQRLAEAAAVAVLGGGNHSGTPASSQAQPSSQEEGTVPPVSAPAGSEQQQVLQQRVAELAAQVEQLEFERAELRIKLEESESRITELVSAAQKLSGGNQQQLLVAKQSGQQQDPSPAGGADWQLAAGHPMPASAELFEAKQALQQAREQEEALRLQVFQLREQAIEIEARNAALQADLASAQASAGDAATAVAAMGDLRRQLEERGKEVADLSALSLKADATVQQYMAQLKNMATELRACELRLEDAEGKLRRRADSEQRREGELAELRGVVGALDAERDALQAELDRKAESAAAQAEASAAEQRRLQDLERALSATEGRLAASNSRVQECEQEMQQLHGQVGLLTQHLSALESEYEVLRGEFHAVTDDLEAMVRENQVVSHQLCQVTQERDEVVQQAQLHSTRATYNEQLARAREGDLQDIRTAYEGLAHENQRLQSTATQLQRELAARDAELAIRADEIASLREAQRSAQSQINQYIADLQAYERQFDSLSRAMHRSDNVAEGLDAERQALLDQLRAGEQVRFELERTREGLQRQLAHAEGGIGVLQARLADAQSDAEALRQRVGLEQARVGELEGLLAMARAEQFNNDAVLAASGAERQIASLKEQKGLLEEQVATLQRQVDGLVQRRDQQEQEISRLRMGLAAQHDAGSARREAQQENAVFVQQLAEAQAQCQVFTGEAEALRVQVAKLEGARDGAEAGLAAAQRELEQLRAALRQPAQAGVGAAIPAHILSQVLELEGQNAALQQQLAALQQGLGEGGRAAEGIQAQLEELQQENDRLLDLLARMDSERAQLSREKTQLVGEVVALRAAAPEEGEGGSGRGSGSSEGAQVQIRELQARLQQEQAKRQQAENSFHELIASLDVLQSPAASVGSGSASGAGRGGAATAPALSSAAGLAASVEQLERESGAVRGSLQRAQQTMSTMQTELSKVQAGINRGSPLQQPQRRTSASP